MSSFTVPRDLPGQIASDIYATHDAAVKARIYAWSLMGTRKERAAARAAVVAADKANDEAWARAHQYARTQFSPAK